VSNFLGQPSLRKYFKIETIAMFSALLLIAGVSLFSLNKAIALSSSIVETALTEIHVTMSLRLALNRSAMPVNDYIIRAGQDEKIKYIILRDETDRQFKVLATTVKNRADLSEILNQSLATWNNAKKIANAIMLTPNPVGNSHAAEQMEEFDALIDQGTDLLSEIYDEIYRDTAKSHDRLHEIENQSTTLVVLLSIIGLAIAISGSIQLARMFFPPLNRIMAGVRLFGRGHLDHRIGNNMPVELDELTHGINDMAGRLDDIYSELRKSSYRDSLTGCNNRRKLDEDILAAYSLANRSHEALTVLMLDLDLFKGVNDTYGHAAGDSILLATAEVIRSQLRKHEFLYRYGGEEFVVILPATKASDAIVLAERICTSVANKKMDVGSSSPITVTVSIGIADNSKASNSIKDIIDLADQALYEAKEAGRNRVHAAS